MQAQISVEPRGPDKIIKKKEKESTQDVLPFYTSSRGGGGLFSSQRPLTRQREKVFPLKLHAGAPRVRYFIIGTIRPPFMNY